MNTEMFSPIASEKEIEKVSAYRLLAWGLTYPTSQRVPKLAEWYDTLEKVFALFAMPTQFVAMALNLLPANDTDRLKTLQIEYNRLFINDVPEFLAPPYASAYTPTGDIIKYPARSVLDAYRQAELTFYSDNFELPDHLAVQLEFMCHLAAETLSAKYLKKPDRIEMFEAFQREFLQQHLLYWVPTWRNRVVKASYSGFYAALAQLVVDWLHHDAFALGLLPLAD